MKYLVLLLLASCGSKELVATSESHNKTVTTIVYHCEAYNDIGEGFWGIGLTYTEASDSAMYTCRLYSGRYACHRWKCKEVIH